VFPGVGLHKKRQNILHRKFRECSFCADISQEAHMVRYLVLCLSVALGLVGCRSAQLGNDQSDMRHTLLRLYEDQVLDNLIRTRERYPIVHVDYSNMTGTMNQAASATLGSTMTRTTNTPNPGFVNTLLKVVTYVVNLSGTASETANLTMTGQPVIAVDSVYQEYIDALAQDPDLIAKLGKDKTLDSKDYHLKREFQGDTWYVPAAKKDAFFNLYLATTVQRQTKLPIKIDVDTTVLAVGKIERLSPTQSRLQVLLKDKIANDSGRLTVFISGVGESSFTYQPRPDIPDGKPTDQVFLNNDESQPPMLKGEDLAKALANKSVRLKNDTFLPGVAPPPAVPNESIRSQLELLRLQQFNR